MKQVYQIGDFIGVIYLDSYGQISNGKSLGQGGRYM